MRDESTENPSMFRLPNGSLRQDYFILKAVDPNGLQTTLHCLMWPTDQGWKVATIYVKRLLQGCPSFQKVLNLAKSHDKHENLLLAGAFYDLCQNIAGAGPFRTTGLQHSMQPMLKQLSNKLSKKSSFETFTMPEGNFDIIRVAAIGFSDGWYLGLWYNVPKLQPDKAMKDKQKTLAVHCRDRYPILTEYFTGVAVHATSMDKKDKGQGYRTALPNEELLNK